MEGYKRALKGDFGVFRAVGRKPEGGGVTEATTRTYFKKKLVISVTFC